MELEPTDTMLNTIYTPYSIRVSPEIIHKLMEFYMEDLILDIIL